MASWAGVQNALFVASIVSLVPAAKSVADPASAPIFSVPLLTDWTTNAVTVPSTSASSPCAARSANVISTCVSSGLGLDRRRERRQRRRMFASVRIDVAAGVVDAEDRGAHRELVAVVQVRGSVGFLNTPLSVGVAPVASTILKLWPLPAGGTLSSVSTSLRRPVSRCGWRR